MNVSTLTMDPTQAREKLCAYRADLHKDSEAVYQEAAAAYERLAKGQVLLRLSQTIAEGGIDENNRPRLAICRADRKEVKVSKMWMDDSLMFQAGPFNWNGAPHYSIRQAPQLTRRVVMRHKVKEFAPGYALVPMVPADVRPKHGQLKDWFVLWEVDHWADKPQLAKAPVDPFLLEHVGGDLYAVLAQWDLTPLEQAILEGAMHS